MTFGRFRFDLKRQFAIAGEAKRSQAVRKDVQIGATDLSQPVEAENLTFRSTRAADRSTTKRRAMSALLRSDASVTVCAASMAMLVGCHHHNKKSPTSAPVFTAHDNFNDPMVQARMPRLQENLRQTQLTAPPTPMLAVAAGTLPLVYLTTQGGSVRIVDEADKSTVFTGAIVANTTIAINAATGVIIGGKRVVTYPLPGDHKYSIYLETDSGPGVMERGTIRPGGPMPATLPSVQR